MSWQISVEVISRVLDLKFFHTRIIIPDPALTKCFGSNQIRMNSHGKKVCCWYQVLHFYVIETVGNFLAFYH